MITYEYDPVGKVIHVRASGILVASDAIKYFEQLDKDPSFVGKAEEHIYFTALKDIAVSYNEIVDISNAFSKFRHGDKISNGVFIVDSDLSFGMARMIISIFGGLFDDFKIQRVDASTPSDHSPNHT